MEKNIGSALQTVKKLVHVREELLKIFKAARNGNETKIGYVAGILNSDGPEYFESNRKKIAEYAKALRRIHKFPIFSVVDVFSDEVYARLEEWKLPFSQREVKARFFWREILKSGHVTDIFMTPRWDKSKGAIDEHKTAKEIGLKIHYV